MSFKRDGDDHELLNRLKHQRVAGLLGNYIPDEEAKLLSNGRFTCLVCNHRPIFDTIQMLSIHRKGKKHILELSKYIKRRSELELEAIRKEQNSLNITNINYSSALTHINTPMTDAKCGKLHRRFSVGHVRRKTIELPSFVNEVQRINTDLKEEEQRPSSASQVRYYLKQLPRKLSLEQSVEREKNSLIKESCKKIKMNKKELLTRPQKSIETTEHPSHLSGWKKDKFGNWVKDPDAEFDSDEEDGLPNPIS